MARRPPPREKALWHPQFATNCRQAVALRAVGNTTIIRFGRPDPQVGHWRLNSGGVFTLMELFQAYGPKCAAQDIMYWYYHAPKIACKRAHSWGSEDVRAAARLRFETFGQWGHRRGRSVQPYVKP